MATTGLLGIIDSRPNNIVLGGNQPYTGTVIDRTMESAITLTETAGAGFYRATASSALSLTQSATDRDLPEGHGSSTLTLTQSSFAHLPTSKTASSPLSITQAASGVLTRARADSTLTLTDAATGRGAQYLSATNTLVMDVGCHKGLDLIEDAASVITVSSSPTHTGTIRVSANSAMTLSSIADDRVKIRSATTSLIVSSAATGSKVYHAISTLALSQTAEKGFIHVFATSPITLTQIARPNPRTFGPGGPPAYDYRLDGNQLTMTTAARSSIQNLSAQSPITVGQSIRVVHPWRVSAESELTTTEDVYNPDTISFDTIDTGLRSESSTLARRTQSPHTIVSFATTANAAHLKASATAESATSALSLVSAARLSKTGAATSSLTVTQASTAILSNEQINDTLELDSLASFKIKRGVVTETETIPIVQSVAFVLVQNDTLCNYSPFIGSTTDPNAPTPPPAALPTRVGLPPGVQFRLEYPATGTVTDTLDMRAPDLGNRDRLAFNRINRETRGGTLVIYADPMWPKIQTLSLTFSGLKQQVARDLLTFIQAHLGGQIKLTDWEGRQWTGVIMTPDEAVVQDSRDRFTANFEFEGVPA